MIEGKNWGNYKVLEFFKTLMFGVFKDKGCFKVTISTFYLVDTDYKRHHTKLGEMRYQISQQTYLLTYLLTSTYLINLEAYLLTFFLNLSLTYFLYIFLERIGIRISFQEIY